MRNILALLIFILSFNGLALAQEVIPERRSVLWRDTDFFGADLRSILDTTLAACESACLADSACRAFTFNSDKSSCFLKDSVGEKAEFSGAFSAEIVPADPAYLAFAPNRSAELSFLRAEDFETAFRQARNLPHEFVVGGWELGNLRAAAAQGEAAADLLSAMRFAGGAAALGDDASDWAEFARLSLALALQTPQRSEQQLYRDQGISAALNAYLRSLAPAQRAAALMLLADGLEAAGRGRDAIGALRLAVTMSGREDIAARLDGLIGKYGFRIVDHRVDADSASPRICASFSEDLVQAGTDYTPFVQAPDSGLAVDVSGRDLCLSGVEHGQRYRLTFRAGLPAASGATLARPVRIDAYVRDRSPQVFFPGRAYVLPALGDASLPLVGINAEEVDLVLYRMSDRNLVEAFRQRYFASPLSPWEVEELSDNLATEVWRGTGELQSALNREITTLLPMGGAIAGQPPGIYMLQAGLPGRDPWDNPPASQWFVISDIGLATMLGADGLHVFARSLASAGPLEGVEIELISRANAVLATVRTDARGHAQVPAGLTSGRGAAAPALVVARGAGGDTGFLSLSEPAFDLSDRGVEGRPVAPPIDVFASTDRGAYRAGETVHATALARDGRARALAGLPLTAVLYRPDGVEYARQLSPGDAAGGHVFALPLGPGVPRGTWRLEFLSDPAAPALASLPLLVEDFLPERIDFGLDLAAAPVAPGGRTELALEARYLFGAPGADLAIEGEVVLRATDRLDAFPGYRFGRADSRPDPAYGALPYDRRTDGRGRAVLAVELPRLDAPGMPVEAQFVLRLSEGSGRPVERRLTRLLRPEGALIGIRPGFDADLPEGAEARFTLLALDPDLAPRPMRLRWRLNRIDTRYQWYALDGTWLWDPVTTRSEVASGEARLGTVPLEIAARVDWGRYELVVEGLDADAGAVSSVEFQAGWYGAADASATPDMLEVSLDAPSYRPGDTATLRLVPRVPGKVLVSVMSDRLIHMQMLEATAGENSVRLPVTDEWGAGAYVSATLVQPMQAARGRLPTRAIGLAYAGVDPGSRRLRVRFEGPDEVAPRGPLEVRLKVEGAPPGAEIHATIAAVDLGILNLTAFDSPAPSEHYFSQRRLGVELRDLYGRLIDRSGGRAGAVRSGGDALARLRMQAPPPTEEPVAEFSGLLRVGADGYARARFDLPAFNGTVRLMAVVWSQRAVGEAERDITVADPVVVTASLPRFLAPGDTARLLLELVHAKGPAGEMRLALSAEGVTLDTSFLPERVMLEPGGTARLALPVRADRAGQGRIELRLVTPDGTELLKELALPVQMNDPERVRVDRITLEPGQSFTLDGGLFADLVPGSGRATLGAGALARLNVAGLLDRLDRYPYGCSEQLVSRALPLLYFGDVARAMGLTASADIPARINGAIDAVLANQSAAGSFGLWRPDSGDLWLDAYVSDFLSRARAAGYAVPDTAFGAAMDNLRGRVNYAPDFDRGGEAVAYALYVLAREGAAAMGDLRYYADAKADALATPLALAQLGAALAAYGDPRRADTLFARAMERLTAGVPEPGRIWRDDYGSDLRDAAAVLALAVEAGSEAVDRDLLVARLAARSGDILSTQEAVWMLLAASGLIAADPASGLSVNGRPATGPVIEVLDGVGPARAVTISNDGERPASLTVTSFGVPRTPGPAGGQGYRIARRYFSIEGEPVELDEVAQGTRLVAVLTIEPLGSSDGRLMVNDPLPAGFEIDNPNLISAGDISALDWLELTDAASFAEFRQERFLAAVDWRSEEAFRLAYVVRAVTPGEFRHPAPSVEDMYRPAWRANGETGRVRITGR